MKITLSILIIFTSALFHTSLTASGNTNNDKKDHDEKKAVPVLSTTAPSSATQKNPAPQPISKATQKPSTKAPVKQPTSPSNIFGGGVDY